MVILNVVQNERTIPYEAEVLFPQFNAQIFKLLAKISPFPIRLQEYVMINISGRKQLMA